MSDRRPIAIAAHFISCPAPFDGGVLKIAGADRLVLKLTMWQSLAGKSADSVLTNPVMTV